MSSSVSTPPQVDSVKTRAPSLEELSRLFGPLSRGGAMLRRCYRILDDFNPRPPAYVYWHLARYVKTLCACDTYQQPGQRWLDISSDPWFCLLAHELFGKASIVPTAMGEGEDIHFLREADGAEYHYAPLQLELREGVNRFPVGSDYDVVTAFEVIEHLQFHPGSFLAGISNALRDGGRLVLTTPNVASWSVITRLIYGQAPHQTVQYGGPMDHRREYTTYEMKLLLGSAGFRLDRVITFNCYVNDVMGLFSALLWLGVLSWHAVTLQAVPVRNLLTRAGSTMLVEATKVGPCDPAVVIPV
jgi:hypothetical protein